MLAVQNATLGYDVENRMPYAIVTGCWEYYGYAPDNKRIWKQKPNGTVELYYYGIGRMLLVEYIVCGPNQTCRGKRSIFR